MGIFTKASWPDQVWLKLDKNNNFTKTSCALMMFFTMETVFSETEATLDKLKITTEYLLCVRNELRPRDGSDLNIKSPGSLTCWANQTVANIRRKLQG